MSKSSIGPQIFAATAASLILVCAGIHYQWPVFLSLEKFDGDSMDTLSLHMVLSTLLRSIGAICALLPGLLLVDTLGRRAVLLLMTIPLVVSCVLIIIARSYLLFGLARFVAGIGIGVAFMVTPMYIGEVADRSIRGGLCVLIPIMLHLGAILSRIIGNAVSIEALAVVGAVVPIVFATALLWSPESPYYFAMKNVPNDIRKSVAWLRGTPDVLQEVQEIQDGVALNRRKTTAFYSLFRVSSNRKALLEIIGLFLFTQMSSATEMMQQNAMMMLASSYMMYARFATFITLVISVITCIYVAFLVDKLGRRPLLLASAALCTIISLVAVLCQVLLLNEINAEDLWLVPTLLAAGSSIGSSIGLGTLPFVLAGEIFSSEIKTFALAFVFFIYFATEIGVTILWGLIFMYIRNAAVFVTLVLNIMSGVFIYFAVPETKGRSLSGIKNALQGHFTGQV